MLPAGLAALGQGFYTGAADIHSVPSTSMHCSPFQCTAVCMLHSVCSAVVDIGSGAGKIGDNGDMCCLAPTHFCHFLYRTKNLHWQFWHLVLVVSFFLGMDRFKFGDTMVTDWVYLRGHGGSGESSNFLWLLLCQFFWVGPLSISSYKTSGYTVNVSEQYGGGYGVGWVGST